MVGLCMDIEGYLKGDSGEQGRSPLEAVRHFLCETPGKSIDTDNGAVN